MVLTERGGQQNEADGEERDAFDDGWKGGERRAPDRGSQWAIVSRCVAKRCLRDPWCFSVRRSLGCARSARTVHLGRAAVVEQGALAERIIIVLWLEYPQAFERPLILRFTKFRSAFFAGLEQCLS